MKKRSMIYVLIAAMAVTLFASAPAADAAKKPALNKKSASLKVGDKLKLKVKNNKKKVTWSTSKKKVATVTKKGVVTAKSAGKAKITAKTGKTKLTCKVTVTKKDDSSKTPANTTPVQTGIKISGITFANAYQIQVQLSGAQALTAANFTVKSKFYEVGAYYRTHKIQSVTSTDKINYIIELSDEHFLDNNSFVQVTVTGLTGTGTEIKEAFYNRGKFNFEQSYIEMLTKGEKCYSTIYFDNLYGNATINSVTGLPAGIKYEAFNDGRSLKLYGSPIQTGTFTAIAKATDELGNTESLSMYFIIGSADTIAAVSKPLYIMVNAEGTSTYIPSYDNNLYVSGGSGSYSFNIIGEDYGMTVNSSGEVEGTIKTPGTYSVKIQVIDDNDPSIATTCMYNVYVEKGKTIKGVVRDAQGAPVSDMVVYFDNKDAAARFRGSSDYTNEKGEYSVLVADGNYTAYAYINGVKSAVRALSVNADQTGIDFTIPIYKITMVFDGGDIKGYANWSDNDSSREYFSTDNFMYLPEGTYNLTLNQTIGLSTYSATITNLVVNAASSKTVSVKLTKTSALDDKLKGDIGLEEKDITLGDAKEYVYYKFVPTETKTYYFFSKGSGDPYGALFDADGNELKHDDDSGKSGTNFLFECECEKDKTYYYGVYAYSSNENTTIVISDVLS